MLAESDSHQSWATLSATCGSASTNHSSTTAWRQLAVTLAIIRGCEDLSSMPRGQRREGDRDDRIIWRTVKNLGARAGVEVHPHALRPAFALRFLESHPGEVEARCSA